MERAVASRYTFKQATSVSIESGFDCTAPNSGFPDAGFSYLGETQPQEVP